MTSSLLEKYMRLLKFAMSRLYLWFMLTHFIQFAYIRNLGFTQKEMEQLKLDLIVLNRKEVQFRVRLHLAFQKEIVDSIKYGSLGKCEKCVGLLYGVKCQKYKSTHQKDTRILRCHLTMLLSVNSHSRKEEISKGQAT